MNLIEIIYDKIKLNLNHIGGVFRDEI